MSGLALRNHSRQILLAVARDMETWETDTERSLKSKGRAESSDGPDTAATEHGTLRHLAGFDLVQLLAEFRAMRASVLALWQRSATAEAGPSSVEEITRFNEAIDQAVAESVESYSTAVSTSRDMFLGVLGHDLRNPLSVINMTSQALLKRGMTEEAQQQAAMRIQRASAVMNRLITDLLDYTRSRLGSGIPITRSLVDVRAACEEAMEAMRAAHPEQRFEQDLCGDLRVEVDAARMQQVLSNLLGNAVQHGDRRAPILLFARGEEDVIELRIANSGAPIPTDALQTIFEPLIRASSAGSDESQHSKSLGLGLFIVREIVLGHGGTIKVQSSESGTVFTIRIPRVAAA